MPYAVPSLFEGERAKTLMDPFEEKTDRFGSEAGPGHPMTGPQDMHTTGESV